MIQTEKIDNIYDTNWLNVIFKNSPIPIAIINNKLEVINANDQYYELIGHTKNQDDALELHRVIHDEDYIRDISLYNNLFSDSTTNINSTQRFIKENDTTIWVNVNITKNPTNTYEFDTFIAVFQDISKELYAKQKVQKSEEKYRNLIENANDGIAILDKGLNIILSNTSFYSTLGFSKGEFDSIEFNKLGTFHPNDIPQIKSIFKDVINGKSIKVEKRLIDKNGKIRYFSLNLAPATHEDKPAIQLIQRETTDRVNEEKHNEEYRIFLETFMDNLPVPIYAKTVSDKLYMYWNKSIENSIGISSDDIIGLSDSDVDLPKSFIESSIEDEKALLSGKEKVKSEFEFINNKGEKKNYINIKSIFNPPTGSPLILGVCIDVSELRIAENIVEQSGYIIKEAQAIAKLGYWEYDIEKDLIYDNIENRKIFGIDEIKNFFNLNSFLSQIHHSSRNDITMNLERCIKKGESGEQVVVINLKNELKHILLNFKPEKSKDGSIKKIKGTAIDITRIKKSELALQESKTKLRQAENLAKVGYWDINYEDNTTELSGEVWNIMCLTQSTANYSINNIIANIHPKDKDTFEKYFDIGNTHPFEFTFRVIAPEGNTKYIKAEGTTVVNSKKEPVKSIGQFQDITAIKEKENKIEYLDSLVDKIHSLSKINNDKTSNTISELITQARIV